MPEHVSIVGAGLGGLMLLRALQLRGVSATVYERDSDAACVDKLGGTLDMHDDAGLLALERVKLMDAFNLVARYEGDATRVFDKDGKLLLDEAGTTGPPDPRNPGRPEVDRADLRRILLDSLDEGTVQWGHTLRRVEVPESATLPIQLHFDGGSVVETDLLVGADGAWSKVRPLLTDVKPEYSGRVYIELMLRDAPFDITDFIGAGSLFCCSGGRMIVSQRNAGTRVRTYAGMKAPLKWDDAPQTADEVAALYPGWSPKILSLITSSTEAPIVRQLWKLSNGVTWPNRPRITLLGDAAHLGLPNGDGANWALLDGVELAETIATGSSIAAYERKICRRAGSSAVQGDVIMEVMDGEAQDFADMLSSFGPPPFRKGPIAIFRWARMLSWFVYRTTVRPALSDLPLLSRLPFVCLAMH